MFSTNGTNTFQAGLENSTSPSSLRETDNPIAGCWRVNGLPIAPSSRVPFCASLPYKDSIHLASLGAENFPKNDGKENCCKICEHDLREGKEKKNEYYLGAGLLWLSWFFLLTFTAARAFAAASIIYLSTGSNSSPE